MSDRDPHFTSNFFKGFCKLAGVHQSMSSAFHPQADGQTERVNRVLEDMLRHYVGPLQDDWDTYLDSLESAYNSSWHESLGTSPFKLLCGRNPQSPGQATHLSTAQAVPSKIPAAADFLQRRGFALVQARKCLPAARDRQKKYAGTDRRDVDFEEGEEVLLSTQNRN